jgi:hypothetical protein
MNGGMGVIFDKLGGIAVICCNEKHSFVIAFVLLVALVEFVFDLFKHLLQLLLVLTFVFLVSVFRLIIVSHLLYREGS